MLVYGICSFIRAPHQHLGNYGFLCTLHSQVAQPINGTSADVKQI